MTTFPWEGSRRPQGQECYSHRSVHEFPRRACCYDTLIQIRRSSTSAVEWPSVVFKLAGA